MAVSSLTITPYERRYLQNVRDLVFRSNWIHTHLDWYETDQWLESPEAVVRLAWQRRQLSGVLGVSRPLNATSWIRLAAVQDSAPRETILDALWDELSTNLYTQGIQKVALLGVRDWILRYAAQWGFCYHEDIITLARAGNELPPAVPSPLQIRSAEWRDLEALACLDQTAFAPPWQLSLDELRQAYRIASSCTVAIQNDQFAGYQLSTLYFDGAHLARLGVDPSIQGTGIGAALLRDLLERYFRRGVYGLTVNTQTSNERSRRLYTRFGFQPTGYNLPYWSVRL